MSFPRKITSILNFKKSDLIKLFELAQQGKSLFENNQNLLKNKILGSFFFEASTRTRISFSSAFLRLGGSIINTSDIEQTRSGSVYHESLEDLGRLIGGYCECVILRTPNVEHMKLVADAVTIPFISAGHGLTTLSTEGFNLPQKDLPENPTQALTDLFTLYQLFGDLNRLSEILIIGNGRAINSLRLGLSYWPSIKIHVLSLNDSPSNQEYLTRLTPNREFHYQSIQELLNYPGLEKIQSLYTVYSKQIIDQSFLSYFSNDIVLLDPMPRLAISREIDTLHNAKYFEQAYNSLYVRGALFVKLFSGA
ncbi:MAG: hypothetical protein AAGG02_00530 [Cyanobacteria bacterium P01_H01_bin.15]